MTWWLFFYEFEYVIVVPLFGAVFVFNQGFVAVLADAEHDSFFLL